VIGEDLLDRGVQAHVHTQARQGPLGVALQPPVERAQQPVGHLHEHDMEVVNADLGIEHRQALGLHLGQRPGGLDPGGSATDDDRTEALVRVALGGHQLKAGEDDVAHLECLPAGVDPAGVLLRPGDTEEIGAHARGDDQFVVANRLAAAHDDLLLLEIDAGHGRPAEAREVAAIVGRPAAQRICDITGVQCAGGHLVEQRLECRVRMPVDDHHLAACLGQLVRGRQPRESSTDDHHARFAHGSYCLWPGSACSRLSRQ